MPSTFERLRDILVRDYSLEPNAVTLDAGFENLGVDSLGLAELLFTIEDEFKVTVSRDPVPLATVAEVVGYIDGLIAAQNDSVLNADAPHLALPG
jgi:acyl carrier protein